MAQPLYTPPAVLTGAEFNQKKPEEDILTAPAQQQAQAQPAEAAPDPMAMENELSRIMNKEYPKSEQQFVLDSILGREDKLPDAGQSIIGNDKTAGFINGIVNDSFTASAGTTIESYQPSWMPSRLTFLDENGDFSPALKSVPEALGISDEQWDVMNPDERRVLISNTSKERIAKHFNADVESTGYKVMNAVGMFADPTTFMPIVGASVKAKAGFSALVGGADMAMWETAHTGAPTAAGVGMGLALGGAIGGGVAKLAARSERIGSIKTAERASKKLATYQKVLEQEMSKTDDPIRAMQMAHQKSGISFSDMGNTIRESRSVLTEHMPSDRAREGLAKGWDEFFEPISEHVKAMNPKIHKEWVAMERGIFETNNKYMMMVDEFLSNPKTKSLDNLKKSRNPAEREAFQSIKKAMLNNDRSALMPLIEKHMGTKGLKAFMDYQNATREAYALLKQYRGTKNTPLAKELDIFAHRVVKDFDLFTEGMAKVKNLNGKSGKEHLEVIENIIKKEEGKLKGGTTLTKEQKAKIYNDYFNGFYDTKSLKRTPSGAKTRFIKELPDEVMPAMHDPLEAMHTYFREVTEDAYRKAFFGKDIVKGNGDSISGSIGSFVEREKAAGRLSDKDMADLKRLLTLRWDNAVKAPPALYQWFKDLGYSALIGNPIAAIVQLGDIPLAMTQYGFRDTMLGLWDVVLKRGYTPEEAGLMNTMMEELVSTGKTRLFGSSREAWWNPSTKDILRRSLSLDIPGLNKIPGVGKTVQIGGRNINVVGALSFKSIDRLGKATHMAASERALQRMVTSKKGVMKLHSKWGEALGEQDFYKLVEDLKAGYTSDDVKTIIFSDLSNIQPISLLEMPAKYLEHPRGRLLYMLRTFQLKYMNLVRQKMWYEMKRGNKKAAIKNGALLMGMFTAGGASTTMLKQFVLGREVYPKDILYDSFLKQTGFLDRYTLEKVDVSKDPLGEIATNIIPPINVFSPLFQTINSLRKGDVEGIDTNGAVKRLPIIGGLAENYLMGGLENFNRKQRANKRRRR